MGNRILLMLAVVGMTSGSSKPICPFDGRVCDGKVLLDAPSCVQETFGVFPDGKPVPKYVGACHRFKPKG